MIYMYSKYCDSSVAVTETDILQLLLTVVLMCPLNRKQLPTGHTLHCHT